jgi:hypothetical protein
MKHMIAGILIAVLVLATGANAQKHGQRYAEYWQSYSNVEVNHPTGYKSNVLHPKWHYAKQVESIPYHSRDCESPYPMPGTWAKHNNSMEHSTYRNWGENKEGYNCDRFLTKPCAPASSCATAPAKNVTFHGASGSDLYVSNSALIDDLKAMYCLPSHIIYRMKSRNDAAYNRARVGGSPAMPGSSIERTTLAGIHDELVKLRSTCVDGAVR